jgi:hypothetical protein
MAEADKQLVHASHLIEEQVLAPLQQLQQNTIFHTKLLDQFYHVQYDFLHGQPSSSSSSTSSSSTSAAAAAAVTKPVASSAIHLSNGLLKVMEQLEQRQMQLQNRFQRMQQKNEELHEGVETYFHLLSRLPKQVSNDCNRGHHRTLI